MREWRAVAWWRGVPRPSNWLQLNNSAPTHRNPVQPTNSFHGRPRRREHAAPLRGKSGYISRDTRQLPEAITNDCTRAIQYFHNCDSILLPVNLKEGIKKLASAYIKYSLCPHSMTFLTFDRMSSIIAVSSPVDCLIIFLFCAVDISLLHKRFAIYT